MKDSAMMPSDRIFVAGHAGLAGSALVRRLCKAGFSKLITRERRQLDLTDQAAVARFFEHERPDHVFLAAAKVGGIHANATQPAEFLRDNLAMQTNVIDAAYKMKAKKLLFLGSSCIYPKYALQPLREEALLTGTLEPTNEAYAIAKIAGLKMCAAYNKQYGTNFLCVMPTNLYGPNDNYDLQTSHVLPALLRKMHEAKDANAATVSVWGTGKPRREFLHSDDMADACVYLMERYDANQIGEVINIGTGEEIQIRELASTIANAVGFRGSIDYDTTMPDGTPRKVLDVSRLHSLGWRHRIGLDAGIRSTYESYLSTQERKLAQMA
jgi:GDP-L-fucose synthase